MYNNYDELKNEYKNKAEEYFNDKEKASELLKNAMDKAKKKGPLEEIWDYLMLMFSLLRDWISGEYREISKGTIIAIIIGLIYFITPIDIIPDPIPIIGLSDDAIVLGLIIKQIKSELDNYREWKEK